MIRVVLSPAAESHVPDESSDGVDRRGWNYHGASLAVGSLSVRRRIQGEATDSDGSTGAARGSTAGPDSPTVDVLRYETDDGPVYRAAPAGEGEPIVAAHERERRERDRLRPVIGGVLALVSVGYGVFTDSLPLGLLGGAVVVVAFSIDGTDGDE